MTTAEKGKKAHIHYTGKFDDGEVFDSSEGKDPLAFEVGAGQVVPGFDKAVEGMKEGDKKSVSIEAADAYGEPRDELVQEVPKEALGEMADKVEEGMVLGVHHPQAPQPIPARVVSVGDDTVKLDMNHPLAGKKLNFDIELVKVE
jgi:peptidylprolyl isomerase